LGRLKVSLSPLLACTWTCTTGAVKSASRISIAALNTALLGVQTGAAGVALAEIETVTAQVVAALEVTV
jgi:hypothetical protein